MLGAGTNAMEMPFGKYEGKPLREIPSGYLRWCLNNLDDMDSDLFDAMEAELRRRQRAEVHRACDIAGDYARRWGRSL